MEEKRRKIFDIMLNDRLHPVYDIEDKDHNWGKMNGGPCTWWIDIGTPSVGENGEISGERLEPFHNSQVNRMCWDIRCKETNSCKYKWDEIRWSRGVTCEMWAIGKLIYSFRTRDIEYAMAKAQVLMVQISEHPYGFFDQEKERGRKIWYYNLPAIVEPSYYPGEIHIKPDYTDMAKEPWWAAYKNRSFRPDDDFPSFDRMEEGYQSDTINWGDALSDGHINWFRK